jgi:hypothetical protein
VAEHVRRRGGQRVAPPPRLCPAAARMPRADIRKMDSTLVSGARANPRSAAEAPRRSRAWSKTPSSSASINAQGSGSLSPLVRQAAGQVIRLSHVLYLVAAEAPSVSPFKWTRGSGPR